MCSKLSFYFNKNDPEFKSKEVVVHINSYSEFIMNEIYNFALQNYKFYKPHPTLLTGL